MKKRRLTRVPPRTKRPEGSTKLRLSSVPRKARNSLPAIVLLEAAVEANNGPSPNLPPSAVGAIAKLTAIGGGISKRKLQTACDKMYHRALFATPFELASVLPPRVLLNRIARNSRQLSQDLVRLSDSEFVRLDGILQLIFPRALMMPRLNAKGQVDVAYNRSGLLMNVHRYGELLSSLADCVLVAADRMPFDEAAKRHGITVRFDEERYAKIIAELPKQRPNVRNEKLRDLVWDLCSLVDGANGKLTLWNDAAGRGPRGTLPAVLAVLRPHLPAVIPETLNCRTLYRYLDTENR